MKKAQNNLVVIENDTPLTTSRIVAEQFGKSHRHVLEAVRDIIKTAGGVPKNGQTPMFAETTWTNEQNGQTYPMYTMTRDGFSLLAMGFTGKKALQFKLKFIDAFNRMEEALKKLAAQPKLDRDPRWIETRTAGKRARKLFTQAIKALEEYFQKRGQFFPNGYLYGHLTNTIQNALSVEKGTRDNQSVKKLNQLDQAEDIAGNVILLRIAAEQICTIADTDQAILSKLNELNNLLGGKLFLPL